jgi:hypothetical protein
LWPAKRVNFGMVVRAGVRLRVRYNMWCRFLGTTCYFTMRQNLVGKISEGQGNSC